MDHRTVMDLAGTDAAAYIRKSRLEEGMDTQEVLSNAPAPPGCGGGPL